jgi:hypothetical protein
MAVEERTLMAGRPSTKAKNGTGGGLAALDELAGLDSADLQEVLAPSTPKGRAAKKDAAAIVIPDLKVKHVTVVIKGLTPLIVHRFGEHAQNQIAKAQDGSAKVKKPPRVPRDEYIDAQYQFMNDDGVMAHGFPAIGIKLAMVAAGMRFADQKSTHLLGMFTVPAEHLEIKWPGEEPIMRTDRVVIGGMSRTTNLAYRPEYRNWRMEVPLMFNPNFISLNQLITIMKIAGFSVGIGEWRVERKGIFGQFDVEKVIQYDDDGTTVEDTAPDKTAVSENGHAALSEG